MISSANVIVMPEKMLRLSNVNNFLNVIIVIRKLLKSVKRCLNRKTLNSVDNLGDSSINDENELKSEF